jgi:hypothetical protein
MEQASEACGAKASPSLCREQIVSYSGKKCYKEHIRLYLINTFFNTMILFGEQLFTVVVIIAVYIQ